MASYSRPNRLRVDLEAVRSNVAQIIAAIGPDCSVIASLKANALGLGAPEVARAAIEAGAVGVAVGELEAALELRQNGLPGLLLVYPGSSLRRAELRTAAEQRITVTAQDGEAARAMAEQATETVDVFAKIDVGHERLGVAPDQALALAGQITATQHLRLVGLITHIHAPATASDEYVQWQLDRLTATMDALATANLLPLHRIAASTSILDRQKNLRIDARLTSADPGRLVLGLGSFERGFEGRKRRALVSLTSQLVQVKPITRDAFVDQAPYSLYEGLRIGIVPLGRADGFDMVAADHVLVRGQKAPVLRIWTEHTTVDITGVPDCVTGDEAVMFGEQGSAAITVGAVLAAHPGLGEMEIAMRIAPSVPRHYFGLRQRPAVESRKVSA